MATDGPVTRVLRHDGQEARVLASFDFWEYVYRPCKFTDHAAAEEVAAETRAKHDGGWSAWRPDGCDVSYVHAR